MVIETSTEVRNVYQVIETCTGVICTGVRKTCTGVREISYSDKIIFFIGKKNLQE